MGDCVGHEPCPQCGSRDNLARYADGSGHCFGCKYNERAKGEQIEEREEPTRDWTPLPVEFSAMPNRGFTKETCEANDYGWTEYNGERCHVANVRDDRGALIGQKVRLPGKKFVRLGKTKDLGFWLKWKFPGGKHLVITEGEPDTLAVRQAMDNKWPVVSLPDGADSAERAIALDYDWLDKFERVVLMFDQDKPGQNAVDVAAPMLPMGKAAIAVLPRKDANDVLRNEGPGAIIRAFWDASIWKPDGIVCGDEFTLDKVRQAAVVGLPFPFPKLQEKVLGMRKGELTLWTAGSGIGKSTMVRELMYHLHEAHGCYIGNIFLEENNVKTAQAYVAIDRSVPLGRLRFDPTLLTTEQWKESLARVVHKGMWFYNHFGSLDSKNLIGKVRYLATVCKVDFVALDHISIAVSGMQSSSEGERKDIDILMTALRSVVEETGVGIHAVVHLKRVQDKDFNEGGKVALTDLRGSASLEQLSDNVYAIERDQQGTTPTKELIRVLKCREMGDLGEADCLDYNRKTGRLELASAAPFDEVVED